jgi:ABC-2 type transport system permease protein
MPAGLRQFAEYQPYTQVTQTVRGLFTGTHVGSHAVAAVAWSMGIAIVSYMWAVRLYDRRRAADSE